MIRRDLLRAATGGFAVLVARHVRAAVRDDAPAHLAALEKKHGGRLGVAIRDAGNGWTVSHRGGEPFLMCSTFKVVLVGAVLDKVDRHAESLDRRLVFARPDVLDWAPVTNRHVGAPGMTIGELCEASITLSDNTAANLLIASLGGPAAVTTYARSLGDSATLLDRIEPDLNPYATTTPLAMLGNLRALLLGDALAPASRAQLARWMLDCRTGLQALRAGLPKGWRVGDKTGSWDGKGSGANNDIAIAWPPHRKPLLVTAYYENPNLDTNARKAVLARVGHIVAAL